MAEISQVPTKEYMDNASKNQVVQDVTEEKYPGQDFLSLKPQQQAEILLEVSGKDEKELTKSFTKKNPKPITLSNVTCIL